MSWMTDVGVRRFSLTDEIAQNRKKNAKNVFLENTFSLAPLLLPFGAAAATARWTAPKDLLRRE